MDQAGGHLSITPGEGVVRGGNVCGTVHDKKRKSIIFWGELKKGEPWGQVITGFPQVI